MNLVPEKPIMVVSHERSGTHFLMNSLAAEFGYNSRTVMAYDSPPLAMNYFSPASVKRFFEEFRNEQTSNIRKSHHQYAFFDSVISSVLDNIELFYIFRDPRDVSHSFRHYLNSLPWYEGPQVASAGEFIRSATVGRMLRYQFNPLPNMLARWQVHVGGWIMAAQKYPEITIIRYEDLDTQYDRILDMIANKKGWQRRYGVRPKINESTIGVSSRHSETNFYTDEDLDFFRQKIGSVINRLGYTI